MRLRRSVLFLPATNERALAKARGLPVDTVVLDLEDAVAAARKDEGRQAAAAALAAGGFGGREVVVRINGLDTGLAEDDISAIGETPPAAIIVPKINRADDIAAIGKRMADMPDGVGLWAMIETAEAVLNAASIAAAGGWLEALLVGTNDLSKDMRLPISADREPLRAALSLCVLAARANGLAIIDGVYNDIGNAEGLARQCAEGRMLGFDGKSLIHPNQVDIANRAFGPTDEEIEAARRIIAAWEERETGKGVTTVDGRMIEALHAEEARRLLQAAGILD